MEKFNIKIFYLINNFAGQSRPFDKLMILLARYLPVIFLLFVVWGLTAKKREIKKIFILGGLSAGIGIALNALISLFFFHPRPFMISIGKTLIRHIADSSFPSDHATLMMSFSLFLCYFQTSRKTGIILLSLAILNGLARVFCGIHFPLDIIGSFLVSLIASLGVLTLYAYFPKTSYLFVRKM